MAVVLSEHQYKVIQLWYLVQHSLTSYYNLLHHFGTIEAAISKNNLPQWSRLKIHPNHIQRATAFYTDQGQEDFKRIINIIQNDCDFVCTLKDESYPQQLRPYGDCPPIIFGQGNIDLIHSAQIAIVGSRKAKKIGLQISYDFSYFLADAGFTIVSGLAYGIDQAAHDGAIKQGRTIAVMATGIDQTYPKSHSRLRANILQHGGTVITEFLPFTPPLQHLFPRRNRIVSALSLAVLVTEATLKSGSLITAKLAAEQGKLIFAIPGHIYDLSYEGCHQLIREGAILVDHPEKIIEDIALPTQWQLQESKKQDLIQNKAFNISAHLQSTHAALSQHGQDLDQLSLVTQLPINTLLSHLIELELEELCVQQFGLYYRTSPSS